ncbi:MAG: two-component sensor histidine kinase [Flavobacteriaceae bacterium]|nr:MAG: two-component sensor histidine kinase [Flavobacteriaceae bacterium]
MKKNLGLALVFSLVGAGFLWLIFVLFSVEFPAFLLAVFWLFLLLCYYLIIHLLKPKNPVEPQEKESESVFRREFMGNISHELKTPLFSIMGYTETLMDGAAEEPMIREKYLSRIKNASERLVHLLKDIDYLSQIEKKTISLENSIFNIQTLVLEVYEFLEMRAESHNIELLIEENYPQYKVVADKNKIEQVLINLYVNALKHAQCTEIVTALLVKDDQLEIRIADNGIGISEKESSRIFERFYRADQSRNSQTGGSGLGLSIVKHILLAHNQTIELDQSYTKGACFVFRLPLYQK